MLPTVLAVGLVVCQARPGRGAISPDAIVRALNSDPRLSTHGPFRLLTEEVRWRLTAQGGGPAGRVLFQKTATQAALTVLRFRPDFRGNLGVESQPWRMEIQTALLLAMATGKLTLDSYFQQTRVQALEVATSGGPLPQPSPDDPPPPPPNRPPRAQFDRSTSRSVRPGQPLTAAVRVIDETRGDDRVTLQLLSGEKILASTPLTNQKKSGLYLGGFAGGATGTLDPAGRYSLRAVASDGRRSASVRQGFRVVRPQAPPPRQPLQVRFGEQTSDRVTPGQPLMVEATLDGGDSKPGTVQVSLLDGEQVVETIALAHTDGNHFRGELPGDRTLAFAPGRTYQLKGVAEAGDETAEAREDLLVVPGFYLQIPSFFNPNSMPRIEKTAISAGGADYQFSVSLPGDAGRGIGQILVDLPEGTVPNRDQVRIAVAGQPVAVDRVEMRGRQLAIFPQKTIPPGAAAEVEIQGLKPTGGGSYGVTVLPSGDLPAYYELTTAFATALQLKRASTLYSLARYYPATYQFAVTIPLEANQPLARLTIGVPNNFGVFGVNLPDPGSVSVYLSSNPDSLGALSAQRPLPAKISIDGRTVVIDFDQPVPPGTTVGVDFKEIRNPKQAGTYLFDIGAFPVGSRPVKQFVGFGRVTFQPANNSH